MKSTGSETAKSEPPLHSNLAMWLYVVLSFCAAFQLFLIQPLIARFILPWFGGTPAVWSICMLFFQTLLLGGYAFSHLLFQRFTLKHQTLIHGALVLVSLLFLDIAPETTWKPSDSSAPISHILKLLLVHVGLPYFILATISPLIQAWLSRVSPGTSPYRLYSVSNIGSLLSLLSYPFLFEPIMNVQQQTEVWSWGYVIFAISCLMCSAHCFYHSHLEEKVAKAEKRKKKKRAPAEPPTLLQKILWFLLSAGGSSLLLSMTNYVCYDVAVFPFLWVMPLSLYLWSFILCFKSDDRYLRRFYMPLALVMMLALGNNFLAGTEAEMLVAILFCFTALFAGCMLCHGELVRLKPAPEYLTSFYLMMSAGGAAGGIFVGMISSQFFNSYLELPLTFILVTTLACVVLLKDKRSKFYFADSSTLIRRLILGIFLLLATVRYGFTVANMSSVGLFKGRNFFGVVRVLDYDTDDPDSARRILRHGRIMHGLQFLSEENKHIATAYYGLESGPDVVLATLQTQAPKRVGAIGLGAGVIATYGKEGEYYRFYEIDPNVIRVAENYFSFLSDSKAEVDVIEGDARLSMEREANQQYDVLFLDAFSGDAIPVHLLTKEAFEIYLRHMNTNGVLALHVSNKHLNLKPVVLRLAKEFSLTPVNITAVPPRGDKARLTSDWILLTVNKEFLEAPNIKPHIMSGGRIGSLWTDNYSNVFTLIRWVR